MSKLDVRPLVPSGLIVDAVEIGAAAITLTVRRPSLESACPNCGNVSRRVHSRYWRSLADLPSHGRLVRLRLIAHRFRCIDRGCPQRIFAERLGGVIAPTSARRTTRLESLIHHLGLTLGGGPAARFEITSKGKDRSKMSWTLRIAALVALTVWTIAAQAQPVTSANRGHEAEEAEHGGTGTDGMPGKASDAHRTVRIEASDLAFNVKQIQVRAGETVRFVITNGGKLRHEFVIASHAEHVEHRAMMQQMPNMEMGNEPNAVTIDPGQAKELVWKFGKDTDVEFACDIPGHAEAGMTGVFRVMQ